MYGAQKIDFIDKYRYLSFVKNTRNNKRAQLSCLPPTSAAAYQHLCRVDYQVQVCLGNELDPENWGWVLKDNSLEPIQTLLPPAPEKLLNAIFCNCKKGCNYNSGCKKVGLFCSQGGPGIPVSPLAPPLITTTYLIEHFNKRTASQDILEEISPLPSSSNTKFISLLHRGRESEILTSTLNNAELQRNMNESEEEKREGVEETHCITCAETCEED
ncbi:hypothetical protein AVEN_219756-1 [Araneus ventricosus]|uniref:Uncharacterized protein n=1 Tax=Araneus ventricosus TaxID=182803 RepID=A0A4Y2UUC1_ARAVE|nr:hypothetical protein AVEN_219756-1 [Araneus ventricosus]